MPQMQYEVIRHGFENGGKKYRVGDTFSCDLLPPRPLTAMLNMGWIKVAAVQPQAEPEKEAEATEQPKKPRGKPPEPPPKEETGAGEVQ